MDLLRRLQTIYMIFNHLKAEFDSLYRSTLLDQHGWHHPSSRSTRCAMAAARIGYRHNQINPLPDGGRALPGKIPDRQFWWAERWPAFAYRDNSIFIKSS